MEHDTLRDALNKWIATHSRRHGSSMYACVSAFSPCRPGISIDELFSRSTSRKNRKGLEEELDALINTIFYELGDPTLCAATGRYWLSGE